MTKVRKQFRAERETLDEDMRAIRRRWNRRDQLLARRGKRA
jgi:hypothetical protein